MPVDYNACMDGETFDPVSGSNALRGVACDVRKAGADAHRPSPVAGQGGEVSCGARVAL
ncbi:MAG: hypothetical protein IPJ99_11320 [Betaproteobacteria bacterium]|nr:hypothetical protein [Betaproteobacteria bacterium]MBK8919575.1 hypothetical protein [Betaproteobacteria bacterium]